MLTSLNIGRLHTKQYDIALSGRRTVEEIVEVEVQKVVVAEMLPGVGQDVTLIGIMIGATNKPVCRICLMIMVMPLQLSGKDFQEGLQFAERRLDSAFFR